MNFFRSAADWLRRSASTKFVFSALVGVALSLLSIRTFGIGSTAPASLCFSSRAVVGQSDITYLGAIRMPLSGADLSLSYGGMSGRIVNGKTHFFLYGGHPGGDPVWELEDPGGPYDANPDLAPRATVVANWGDVYQGHRVSWDTSGAPRSNAPTWPYGLYWNETTQLLYWTWYDSYNTGYIPDWNIGATRLEDVSSQRSTAYGPWRTKSTDADGKTWYGMWRCMYLFANPTDGSMLCGASMTSGVGALPWGPDAYGGSRWPVAQTPAGLGSPDLDLRDRYLEYYFMGNAGSPNHVNLDGSFVGTLRSFRRRTDQALFEYFPTNYDPVRVDPAKNGGVGSWSDMDFTSGAVWLELNNKRGVVYSGTLNGSPVQNPSDCANASHEWYRNAGVGHDTCSHGCPSPVGVTGPVTTHSFPALIIYDSDDLIAVKNGTKADYSVEPTSVINLETAYSIVTAPQTELQGKSIAGMYFDPVRKYLFVVARAADTSRAGPTFREPLIHVFAIRD